MTELLNGGPTPSAVCFKVISPHGVLGFFTLVLFSISRQAVIYDAAEDLKKVNDPLSCCSGPTSGVELLYEAK